MSDLFPVTIETMVDEVRREIAARRSVYPRLVTRQQMSARMATRRIEIMEAVLTKLEAERDGTLDEQYAR